MKRLFTGFLLFIVFSGLRANQCNDSTYTLKNAIRLHIAYPDSALHILDVIEQEKSALPCLINNQRGLIYYTQRQLELAYVYAHKAYTDDSLKAHYKNYLQVLSILADICRRRQDYEQSIQYLDENIRIARSTNDRQEETIQLFYIGECYYSLRQYEEANRYFNKAIEYAEADKGYKLKPTLSYFYGQLTSKLEEENKIEEALELCRKREAVIKEMESYKNIPIGYLDQQRGYLYIKQAALLATLGDSKQSAQAYQRFKATQFAATKEGQDFEAQYYLRTKNYDKVIDYYLPQCQKDSLSPNLAMNLEILVEAYKGKQDYRQAFLFQQRLTNVKDSLSSNILRSQLAEQNVLMQMHEKEWTIKAQERKLKAATSIRTLLLCLLALAILCIAIMVRNTRIVKQKNRKITARLNEQIAYEDKIEELKQRLDEEVAQRNTAVTKADIPESQSETSCPNETEYSQTNAEETADKEIFEQMEHLIKEQKLYKNPELSRQDMLNLLSISKNRFAQMMQANTQMSFPQYITNLRLHYSLSLLNKYDNYTIQAIADEAGFASLRTFRRAFKAKYGINPSEYRESRLEADTDETQEED